MTNQQPKIAALIADAFQEEEYFFPKVALNEAGYQVEVVSSVIDRLQRQEPDLNVTASAVPATALLDPAGDEIRQALTA